MGKLRENCRRPQVPFLASFFRGELITQVMSSCKLVSVTVVAYVSDVDIHTLNAHTETTATSATATATAAAAAAATTTTGVYLKRALLCCVRVMLMRVFG